MTLHMLEPIPRTFAELPLTRHWQSVRLHLAWLDGAEEIEFACKGGVCWLIFNYAYQSFQFCEHGTRLELSVADSSCSERIIDEVTQHFTMLLAPQHAIGTADERR